MSAFAEYGDWLVVEVAGRSGAATIAGKLFADLGCTVARVEDSGSAAADRAADETAADRALFELQSRGKHSVALDWRSGSAAEPLAALLSSAEIAIVDRDGLLRLREAFGTNDPHARFPRLTLCVLSWFGIDGPMAGWQGGEEIIQAVTGIMSITGPPGSGPTRVAGAPFSHAAAMFAVTSSLADVLRKRAGAGTGMTAAPALLDVCVYDAAIAFACSSRSTSATLRIDVHAETASSISSTHAIRSSCVAKRGSATSSGRPIMSQRRTQFG